MATKFTAEEARQQAARDVLGFFDLEGGWALGGFTISLITTFQRADAVNRLRLGLVFPDLHEALRALEEGEARLKEWAGIK